MSVPSIKFNRRFKKLGRNKYAYLESIVKLYVDNANDPYWRGVEQYDADGIAFLLSSTWYLRLLFIGGDGIPFTMYCKCDGWNCAKYYPEIGCWFKIEVAGEREEVK